MWMGIRYYLVIFHSRGKTHEAKEDRRQVSVEEVDRQRSDLESKKYTSR